MLLRDCVVAADAVWVDGQFKKDVQLRIDRVGRIACVGPSLAVDGDTVIHLKGEALLPGFVNSHSHAFHKQLRGRSRIGGQGADTFWKWRDDMYSLVENVTYEKLKEYCLETFSEMLAAGITTVGEFHYVHHGEERFSLDRAVLDAASECGIRIVLIQTLYERAGFVPLAPPSEAPPLHAVQARRFTSELDEFKESVVRLRKQCGEHQHMAVAAHSLRAVSLADVVALWEWSEGEELPFHMHLEEQPAEIDACKTSKLEQGCNSDLGKEPSSLLLANLSLNHRFTAVHSTYTTEHNMREFEKRGVNVSVCPCTEGYLGDGVPHLPASIDLSLGSDCNCRISMLEEMRWAVFSQNMRHNSRSVSGLSAERMLSVATQGGARSLGLQAQVGEFKQGQWFDFVSVSMTSPVLAGIPVEQFADAFVFSADNSCIKKSGVAGRILFEQ